MPQKFFPSTLSKAGLSGLKALIFVALVFGPPSGIKAQAADDMSKNAPYGARSMADRTSELRKQLDEKVAADAAKKEMPFVTDISALVTKFVRPGMRFDDAVAIVTHAGVELYTSRRGIRENEPSYEAGSLSYKFNIGREIFVSIDLYRSTNDGGKTLAKVRAILRNTDL